MREKKPISLATKRLSRAQKVKAEYAESLIKGGDRDQLALENVRHELVDDVAVEEYVLALEELRKLDFLCNLDRNNLVAFANAASLYRRCTEMMKAEDFELITENKMGQRSNPVIQLRKEAYQEMRAAGDKLGMSVSARLKAAELKIDKQEEELAATFGDI